MTTEIDDGSKFPDLLKAGLGKTLEDLIKPLVDGDREFFKLAQTTKEKLRKQSEIDLKSFIQSQAGAIERGNKNACESKNKFDAVAQDLSKKVQPIVLPGTRQKLAVGQGKYKTDLPKTRSVSPTRGAISRPPSMARARVNQSIAPGVSGNTHYVQPVETNNSPDKAKRNLTQFTRAHSGLRGTSIGDRAVVFSANGTPHYGDSYLDRNMGENLAANQATANAPTGKIPSKLEAVKPISAAPLQQQPRANITPKSNNVTGMLVLGGIAAAVTAVLFFFQHVLLFVQFIMQISSSTSTITNIASSFVAILNNVGALIGLGEGILEPLETTFDSILNNTFGKEKVDYVKFQFAKISSAFVAGQNILSSFGSMKDKLGNLVSKNANNTSKIGNALKMIGMIADSETWMNENNKVNDIVGSVKEKLESVSGLASTLTDITNNVKSAKEQLEGKDKEKAADDKDEKASTDKATEKHSDPEIPDAKALEEPES